MKILVIGNGFIATPIIQRLESEDHDLLIYSRTTKRGIQSRQIVGDLFDFENFVRTLSWGPHIIIHSAWVTAHGHYTTDQVNYKYAEFTSELARYIANTDVKHLVVLGSGSEYGTQKATSTAGITRLKPENLYARQKVIAFNSAKALLSKSKVRLSWARIFQPYGPRQDKKRLLPYMIDALENDEQIRLNDTSSVLDWITTRDIASAISWVINNDTPTEVDIGTTFGFTNVELLRHLEGLVGGTVQWKRFAERNSSKGQVSLVGKNSPLFESGWLPSDDLDSGLKWVLGL